MTDTRSISDSRALHYVVWELTLRCDLACEHCGSRAGRPREAELTTTEALAVVQQLAALETKEVTLIGGEAYLHEGFTTVVRAIADAGIRCTMGTGGRGITPERAKAIAEAGMHSVGVSVDGMRETHDQLRGVKGSFDAALRALRNLHDAGVTVGVNTQINRLNRSQLEQLLEILVEQHARGWQLQLTVPMGRAADHPEWLLQPYDLLELFPRLAALATEARKHRITFWPSNNVGYFGPLQETFGREGSYFQGCVAGRNGLGIESDGSIKGCPSLPSHPYRAGNLRDTPIATLRETASQLRFTYQSRVPELWGYCAECYYARICQGGCSWMAHSLLGRRGNNPYCHHRALEFAAKGLRERVVLRAEAPGLPFDHGQFELLTEALDAIEPSMEQSIKRHRLPVL